MLSLDQALRDGAIVNGMDISEQDVRAGEEIASQFRKEVLASGDVELIRLINRLPDASLGVAARVISQCAGYK